MNYRKLIYLLIWLGLTFNFAEQLKAQNNEMIAINDAISNNDGTKLSTYFQSTLSLSVPNLRGNNSKLQARYILEDFFRNYPVHKTEEENRNKMADGSYFCILKYESTKTIFNFYYKLRNDNDTFLISEIQIKERSK